MTRCPIDLESSEESTQHKDDGAEVFTSWISSDSNFEVFLQVPLIEIIKKEN